MSGKAILYNPRPPGGLDPMAPHKKPPAAPTAPANPVPTAAQKALANAQKTREEAKKSMESKVGIPKNFPVPLGWKFADGGELGNILVIKR